MFNSPVYPLFVRRLCAWLFLAALIFFSHVPSPVFAGSSDTDALINAFFLNDVPTDYVKIEKLFGQFRDSGANSIIIKPLMNSSGIDGDALTNAVFLSHHAGLKLFIIVPSRRNDAVFREHPDWEDLRYDLSSGTIQSTDKLDLSLQPVQEYLVKVFKEVASYSVDGILLGEDFIYEDTEGMSPALLDSYQRKFGSSLIPGNAFLKVNEDTGAPVVEEYGESFWNWAEMKNTLLTGLMHDIAKGCRSVNKAVQIGMTVPLEGFISTKESMVRYSYDLNAFRKTGVDYYWIPIRHREFRMRQNLSYKKSMEILAKIVRSTMSMVKEPAKVILAVQTSTTSGRILPFSEIEEATSLIKQAGNTGMAFMVTPETPLPATLTKKLFKRK